MVNVSTPLVAGVPLITRLLSPLAGTVSPLIAPCRLVTASVTVPAPPLAVIVWS